MEDSGKTGDTKGKGKAKVPQGDSEGQAQDCKCTALRYQSSTGTEYRVEDSSKKDCRVAKEQLQGICRAAAGQLRRGNRITIWNLE